jgi:polar amino acid transport system substrate-binding protein
MKHNRLTATVILICLVGASLLVYACARRYDQQNTNSAVSQPSATSVVDKIPKDHVLHAAYVVYPPFVTKDANTGKVGGYFIDLMNEIAAHGNFRITYEEAKWGTMVAGLEGRRYDLVVSGIFPTIPRSLSVAFARPVMYIGLSGVVSAKNTHQWTLSDLQQPGLRVAVVNGEVGDEYRKQYLPNAKATVLDSADISRAAAEVAAGRADVALAESITMVQFAAANPSVRTVFVDQPLQVFGSTLMLRRGDPDWLNFLNTAIDFEEQSGFLRQLDAKYKPQPGLWRDHSLPWK